MDPAGDLEHPPHVRGHGEQDHLGGTDAGPGQRHPGEKQGALLNFAPGLNVLQGGHHQTAPFEEGRSDHSRRGKFIWKTRLTMLSKVLLMNGLLVSLRIVSELNLISICSQRIKRASI